MRKYENEISAKPEMYRKDNKQKQLWKLIELSYYYCNSSCDGQKNNREKDDKENHDLKKKNLSNLKQFIKKVEKLLKYLSAENGNTKLCKEVYKNEVFNEELLIDMQDAFDEIYQAYKFLKKFFIEDDWGIIFNAQNNNDSERDASPLICTNER